MEKSILDPAPIALFTFNRLRHTQDTVGALQSNKLSASSDLFVFSDGPRHAGEAATITAVREYITTIEGFKSVSCIERTGNLGLAASIIAGVTDIVNRYGRVIVLEDDMITSPYFLQYMNDALQLYQDEERVVSVHGYVYPVSQALPETFFLRGADCWGWATWKRGWDLFEADGRKLLQELEKQSLGFQFDYDGTYGFTDMLKDQIHGRNNSWAIRWNASAFLKDKLTLYPGRSLVLNTGLDSSGVHSGSKQDFLTTVAQEPVQVLKIAPEENRTAREAFKVFFRSRKPSAVRQFINRVKYIFSRL